MADEPIVDAPVATAQAPALVEETDSAPEADTTPTPTLIDRITGAATDFAAGVRKMETASTEHGQTVTARMQAQTAEDVALKGKTDAKHIGVVAADKLIAVVTEWRTAAVSG